MLKRLMLILLVTLCLAGCSLVSNPIKGNAAIDWIDFVKLNGKSYSSDWGVILTNPEDVEEIIDEVKFKVGDVVTNPNYRTKNGDAGYLNIGTKLYSLKGFSPDEVIVAEDSSRIGGYRVYQVQGMPTLIPRFDDLPMEEVTSVSLYKDSGTEPFRTLEDKELKQFIQLLQSGRDVPGYTPDQQQGDPVYYKMVFDIGKSMAYAYGIADNHKQVFFSPWETRLVNEEIRMLLAEE